MSCGYSLVKPYLECGGRMKKLTIKIQGKPVTISDEGKYYIARFGFDRAVIKGVKEMFDPTWDGKRKVWRIIKNAHNEIQMSYYRGEDPFAIYKKPLIKHEYPRPLLEHQIWMADSILTYHNMLCIFEMGIGKSLASLSSAEKIGAKNIWVAGPISGLRSVERELVKWNFNLNVTLMTYNKITSLVKAGIKDEDLPDFLICDESSRLKTPTSQRSKATFDLVNQMRKHNPSCYVVLMTGTPSPKSPVDYFSQMKIVCQGFLKEATAKRFEERLCVMKLMSKGENAQGEEEKFNKNMFWLNDENNCKFCGKPEDEWHEGHTYTKSINEVNKLYERMKGPTIVKLKKDAVNLPEKIFEVVQLKPTVEMLRDVKAIKALDLAPPQLATQMQEISDGFLYVDKKVGEETCTRCLGDKVDWNPETDKEEKCPKCGGSGIQDKTVRDTKLLKTPKDQAIKDQLEEHEELGRLVIWGGFKATINRLVDLCLKQGWTVLRADGDGFIGIDPDGGSPPVDELLAVMDKSDTKFDDKYEKVVFIGNPLASSMGITLTSSPTAVYYSNSYNAESRMQSIDRIHRIGITFSPRIVDLICLPIDRLVLKNLEMKKDLQDLTLEELEAC